MTGRKKYGESLERLMIQSIQYYLWNTVEQWEGMSVHGLLVFSDDVTEHRSRQKNSEVYIGISDAQMVVISAGVAVDPRVGWVG